MNKLKIGAIVLATVMILAAGACLPKLVSDVLDWFNNGTAASNPIASVELEITKDISPLGRLAMLSNAAGNIELTENKAKMTKEEVLINVREKLQPYIDTQLVAYSEHNVALRPCLIQVPDMLELQGIVWFISIAGDTDYISYLELVVDDETGHILQIQYVHERWVDEVLTEETLSLLADIFFSALDIDYNKSLVNAENVYADNNLNTARQYSFNDPQYGKVFVDFYIYPDGFFTECSVF